MRRVLASRAVLGALRLCRRSTTPMTRTSLRRRRCRSTWSCRPLVGPGTASRPSALVMMTTFGNLLVHRCPLRRSISTMSSAAEVAALDQLQAEGLDQPGRAIVDRRLAARLRSARGRRRTLLMLPERDIGIWLTSTRPTTTPGTARSTASFALLLRQRLVVRELVDRARTLIVDRSLPRRRRRWAAPTPRRRLHDVQRVGQDREAERDLQRDQQRRRSCCAAARTGWGGFPWWFLYCDLSCSAGVTWQARQVGSRPASRLAATDEHEGEREHRPVHVRHDRQVLATACAISASAPKASTRPSMPPARPTTPVSIRNCRKIARARGAERAAHADLGGARPRTSRAAGRSC